MARAARDPRREAARLGLLILATACAAAQEPPGGPPDFTPPVLLAIRPDTGAILPGFADPVVFEFDEVVREQQATEMAKLFVVSPRHEEVRVTWKRSRLEVKPKGGWRDGAVYRIVLLPGVSDLRNNRLRAGGEVVFSTGPPIPDTRVAATIVDWAGHRIAARGLLEAFPLPITEDSTAYIAQADSTGAIALTRLPPGEYLLVGVVDENTNRRRDRREAFDSMTVRVDSAAEHVFWAFAHDTVGPQVREVAQVDSVTVRLTFNQRLLPALALEGIVSVWLLPDSVPVEVGPVWTTATYDSVRAAEAAARDSARAAAADSAAAGDSTAVADTSVTAPRPAARDEARPSPRPPQQRDRDAPPGLRGPAGEPGAASEAVIADSARVAELLAQRPKLLDQLVFRLPAPLVPGARYLIEARTTNVSGASAAGRTLLAVRDTTSER